MLDLLREIAIRARRHRSVARPPTPVTGDPAAARVADIAAVATAAMPAVEYLAETRPLRDLLPVTAHVEVKLLHRLIRTHHWAMPEHELLTLGAVVAALQPRRIFEFGTFMGGATLVMAANSPDDASLTTIDVGYQADYPTMFEPGELCRNTRFAARISQLRGDSRTFDLTPYFGAMDLALVDANHEYECAKNDTVLAFRLLRPGGVVVWHDYTWLPEDAECVGVTLAVNEVQRERGRCFHLAGTRFAMYLP